MPETAIAGRYRLVELLGRGGMSEVWRAEDLELGRDVALKLLAPDADRARFEREARAVASLGHPNVVQVYDYGESEGRPFMVLECVPNGTLEDRLRDGIPLDDADASAAAAGIAAGLAHAHARGVVHRDLKPANVLFDDEGRPKLADFGIARLAAGEGTLTEAGTVLGTAAYISPEQAQGEPATAASDVYSFGVILYRMLTGRLPFVSDDPIELVRLHRDAQPPPLMSLRRGVPGALAAAATASLAKDPRERPPDGAALLAELGVPAGRTTTAATEPFPDAATQVLPTATTVAAGAAAADAYPEPPRRSRVPLLVTAIILLALAGAAVAYEVTRPSATPTPAGTTAPSRSTSASRHTTSAAASTTQATTTAPATTSQTTTHQATTAPPTTTAPQPTTTAPPTTATTAPTTATTATLPTTVETTLSVPTP